MSIYFAGLWSDMRRHSVVMFWRTCDTKFSETVVNLTTFVAREFFASFSPLLELKTRQSSE